MKEREAKLAAPPGFDVPELGGPGDGFQAEPRPERRLQTTYYDTPDLRLARWGASLRYRPGEGWTVKLPEGQNGVLLVRAEHVFAGDGRKPPAEAVALVRAFVRTGRLAPSARMHTATRVRQMRSPSTERATMPMPPSLRRQRQPGEHQTMAQVPSGGTPRQPDL